MTRQSASGDRWAVVVDAHEPCWLATWSGDPGRTCDVSVARLWDRRGAERALARVRKRFPLRSYQLQRVILTPAEMDAAPVGRTAYLRWSAVTKLPDGKYAWTTPYATAEVAEHRAAVHNRWQVIGWSGEIRDLTGKLLCAHQDYESSQDALVSWAKVWCEPRGYRLDAVRVQAVAASMVES